MQRLIDANAILKHKEVCELDDGQSFEYIDTDTINNALTIMKIPDNPTNGDMVTAMFSNVNIWKHKDGFRHVVEVYSCGKYVGEFDLEWWNAPYKAESEG